MVLVLSMFSGRWNSSQWNRIITCGHLQSTYSLFLSSYLSSLPSLFKEFSWRWRHIINKHFPIWYHPLNSLIRWDLTSTYILGFCNLLLKNDLTVLRLKWYYLLVIMLEWFLVLIASLLLECTIRPFARVWYLFSNQKEITNKILSLKLNWSSEFYQAGSSQSYRNENS